MRWWSYLLIGLGAYLLFMLIELPAQHVLGWVSSKTNKLPFSFSTVTGTLRKGKAEDVSYKGIPLGDLRWRFKPSNLLTGSISFDIKIRDEEQSIDGRIARILDGSYQLEAIKGQVLATIVPKILNLSQVEINGKIDLNLNHLTIKHQRIISTDGQIKWLNPAMVQPFKLKVGDLNADLTMDGQDNVKVKIKDLRGVTSVDGELSLTSEGNFNLNGTIKPGAEADPGLSNALKAIAKPQKDGSFLLSFNGNL
ncbi:MAG: type II secretion system protein N [Candidatus Thiodiazotropha sp. (ex Lucinoma aequizonata)]|nr:type II secretion system protein N [Candidatus Thiodiazotropha sp. (ex Lucinoma aequizonata)]MCU7888420.1 type II secretion system protein N [Candidatus Thiodiazotropha sp. (ex Lucinoma aequizonata)]MCU7896301.1 type II secretion system protein N [Candidatus Thiodiazotropha sp. (ex Lucinoma aequizonata)]MCU7897283.1 type II secretion system protein N [Candidatus Thiodiazotropha sp. (ex Lucinoma aequizonata)]MCU7903953.1 type II secretion system protein N [Candidatus Thiodiazotropha sp. (ex L